MPLVCGNSSCLNGGTCLISGNQTICRCPSIFTGSRCESLISPCDSKMICLINFAFVSSRFIIKGQPCVNGGICNVTATGRRKRQTVTPVGFLCQCPSLYTGTRCESIISLCESSPCQNNGTCYQDLTLNIVYCACTSNYTGIFCNTTANETNICKTNPSICLNGGTCQVNSSSPLEFSCACSPTTTGFYCEQLIDQCQKSPTPCANNGTCVS